MASETITYIIIFSLLGSAGSLIGGVVLLWKERWAKSISLYLVSFAAGVLLAVAFLDLLPEAIEKMGALEIPANQAFPFALAGLIIFFFLEHTLWWYHHHHFSHQDHPNEVETHTHKAFLIILGDALHNFIDGIVIATSFFVSVPLGISTSLAVIAHEVPQEIADFGVLLHMNLTRFKVFFYNLLAALTTLGGALLTLLFASLVEDLVPYILAFAAGSFIYIASSDLIPELHHKSEHKRPLSLLPLFLLGVALILVASFLE